MPIKTKPLLLFNTEVLSGFLIISSFFLAIFIANTDLCSQLYKNLIFLPLSFGFGKLTYQSALINFVNDGLMVLFFLLIGLELKFHLVWGEYQDRKALILPAAAAIGGIIIPILIYLYFNLGTDTVQGWAIPIATDTACMLGVLALFTKAIPSKLRAFIISFSLIDDAIALLILAIFYKQSSSILAIVVSLLLLILLFILNRCKVKNSFFYLAVGSLLWMTMVAAGVHGALCGAIVALMIPIKIDDNINPSFRRLEKILRPFVYFLILPLFIFLNAGIRIDSLSREVLTANITIGIILGLFIGKQLGILSFSYGIIKMKWCSLPHNVSWMKFYAICVLAGIGFTLSLFIGDLTFEAHAPNHAMRAGVILGSTISACFGAAILTYLANKKDRTKGNA